MQRSDYHIVSKLEMMGRSKGCSESPVATLLRFVNELGEGEAVFIKLDPSRFPLNALKVLVEKMGYGFEYIGQEGGLDKCVVYRPASNGSG